MEPLINKFSFKGNKYLKNRLVLTLKLCSPDLLITFKLQLHDAIYRVRFHSNSWIDVLSLSNSHSNVASIQKNRDDKSHRVIVALFVKLFTLPMKDNEFETLLVIYHTLIKLVITLCMKLPLFCHTNRGQLFCNCPLFVIALVFFLGGKPAETFCHSVVASNG